MGFESQTFRLRGGRSNHCLTKSDNNDKLKVDCIVLCYTYTTCNIFFVY